ncbi:MAG: hypothetical protein REI64_14675 [Pedobacter sp.]|uniref:hypothetical protein n=1 Tax=Pedobacter sp. TaxID=1411316 RepID=UPI00280704FF|nr:hypothetical protein [Pedobacter sp.]MDQ8006044.1 hypothetical protein [Pedobacter sp.]
MKIVLTFLSLVFAIYAAVRGIDFVQREDNTFVLFGVGCLLLAVGLAYITVKSALKKKSH